jgi:hypothetical protein
VQETNPAQKDEAGRETPSSEACGCFELLYLNLLSEIEGKPERKKEEYRNEGI